MRFVKREWCVSLLINKTLLVRFISMQIPWIVSHNPLLNQDKSYKTEWFRFCTRDEDYKNITQGHYQKGLVTTVILKMK